MDTALDQANDWQPDAPPRGEQAGFQADSRALRRAVPDVYRGFAGMHDAALRPGALDTKTKELMALAIAVAQGCERCIDIHARAAQDHGAAEAEVAEALGVAILMSGGPGTSYAPVAFAAYRRAAGAHPTTGPD
jgi:AhpD family alkylhydroperoxidase